MNKRNKKDCFILLLTFLIITTIISPLGYSYAEPVYGINYNTFIIYAFLAYTIIFGVGVFMCGAPGLLCFVGGFNGIAKIRGLDIGNVFNAGSSEL